VEQTVDRRLAAIMAADVVGYSRLIESNEERTLDALKQHRQDFFDPTIARFHGRIFKVMGDGFLVVFNSVLHAARCAVEIQRGMPARNAGIPEDRQIKFRIGINLGDFVVDGDDLNGEGVNLASRLEGLARPGEIACSAIVREQIGNKLGLDFRDKGEHRVKNIERPVRVYVVDLAQVPFSGEAPAATAAAPPSHPDKPSIAVLPFTNMSSDPDQEFFADGITEDIITDLSKVSRLFVLGRNTVFTYKGKAVVLRQVAKELGVAYLLEGSVRKAQQRVRINAQLIDGSTGGHLWAERYDGDLQDIFALQDEITHKIVEALKVELLPAESRALKATPTRNVEAYTAYLRGRECFNRHLMRHYRLARAMFAKAVELDPDYADAYAGIADCDSLSRLLGQRHVSIDSILANSAKAIELDANLAQAHASHGLGLWLSGENAKAETQFRQALALDPNLYEANYFFGRYCRARGHHQQAADLLERASEVKPDDFNSLFSLAGICQLLADPDKAAGVMRRAIDRAEQELRLHPENARAAALAAGKYAGMGETGRARELLDMALTAEPDDLYNLYNVGCAFALLGETDRALDALERARPMIGSYITLDWVRTDPDLVALRPLARFQALLMSLEPV